MLSDGYAYMNTFVYYFNINYTNLEEMQTKKVADEYFITRAIKMGKQIGGKRDSNKLKIH